MLHIIKHYIYIHYVFPFCLFFIQFFAPLLLEPLKKIVILPSNILSKFYYTLPDIVCTNVQIIKMFPKIYTEEE